MTTMARALWSSGEWSCRVAAHKARTTCTIRGSATAGIVKMSEIFLVEMQYIDVSWIADDAARRYAQRLHIAMRPGNHRREVTGV